MKVVNTTDTYRDLLSYHTELQQSTGSVFFRFNQNKINEFHKNNGARINALIEKLNILNEEYFAVENKLIQRNENGQPLLLDGKSMDDYNTEKNELLDQSCEIVFKKMKNKMLRTSA